MESFCLFGYKSSELGDINYLKYHRNNNFKCEIKGFFTSQVIEEHIKFLNDNFNEILEKIKLLLSDFKRQLIHLNNNFNNINFDHLLKETTLYTNYFFGSNNIFNYENIKELKELKNFHPRYKYNLDVFFDDIKTKIIENVNNIDKKYLNKKETFLNHHYKNLSSIYAFGKLYSKHPIFGISYFKEKFNNEQFIIEELINMENNLGNNLEYYSSYYYLQYLLNRDFPDFFTN